MSYQDLFFAAAAGALILWSIVVIALGVMAVRLRRQTETEFTEQSQRIGERLRQGARFSRKDFTRD